MTSYQAPKIVVATAKEPAGQTHADAVARIDAENILEDIKQILRNRVATDHPTATIIEWRWSIRTAIDGATLGETQRTDPES